MKYLGEQLDKHGNFYGWMFNDSRGSTRMICGEFTVDDVMDKVG